MAKKIDVCMQLQMAYTLDALVVESIADFWDLDKGGQMTTANDDVETFDTWLADTESYKLNKVHKAGEEVVQKIRIYLERSIKGKTTKSLAALQAYLVAQHDVGFAINTLRRYCATSEPALWKAYLEAR